MSNIFSRTISKTILAGFFLFSFLIISCKEKFEQNANPIYLSEINQWHQKRIENLKKENGWLNLVGLYWLKNGENKFGSAAENDIVFPSKAPGHIGTFNLKDSVVTIKILPDKKVLHNGTEVSEMEMQIDLSGDPAILRLNSLRWFVIKRGERYGIRLRDLDAPLIKEFTAIDRFPVDTNWRIETKLVPYPSPKRITIPNVLGDSEEEMVTGKLVFNLKGEEFSLDPIDSGKRLFIIFADETNGESTYGAGRFLYTDKPDIMGKVILDFNKAYNPPCAFTKFATCPLPPEQNRLGVKITAGEKNFGKGH